MRVHVLLILLVFLRFLLVQIWVITIVSFHLLIRVGVERGAFR